MSPPTVCGRAKLIYKLATGTRKSYNDDIVQDQGNTTSSNSLQQPPEYSSSHELIPVVYEEDDIGNNMNIVEKENYNPSVAIAIEEDNAQQNHSKQELIPVVHEEKDIENNVLAIGEEENHNSSVTTAIGENNNAQENHSMQGLIPVVYEEDDIGNNFMTIGEEENHNSSVTTAIGENNNAQENHSMQELIPVVYEEDDIGNNFMTIGEEENYNSSVLVIQLIQEKTNAQEENHPAQEYSEQIEPENLNIIIEEHYPEIVDNVGYQDNNDDGDDDDDGNDDNIDLDPNYCADKDECTESTSSDDEDTSQLRSTPQGELEGVLVEAVAERTNQLEPTSRENDSSSCTGNSRKRSRRSELWKKNTRKRKLNHGEEYINSMGKIVQKRDLKGTCGNSCRLKCNTKINDNYRVKIRESFWKLGDINKQREFIIRHCKIVETKYRYVREGSNRSKNFSFHLSVNSDLIRVCKTMFLNTLSISNRFVSTAWKKVSETGTIEEDRRGKHKSSRKIEKEGDDIREHINSIQRVPSHYCRARSNKEYFDGTLNISRLYDLYVEKIKKHNEECIRNKEIEKVKKVAKKHVYSNIFNFEFNISFFQPKKDQCNLCSTFQQRNVEDRADIQNQYDSHIEEKEKSREEKKKDMENCRENAATNALICFDFEAILTVPCGECSSLYYKRKLSCLNFTAFDLVSNQATCFFWTETTAKKGSNEVSSCLLKIIEKLASEGKKKFIFYADNCIGQNKNKNVVALFLYAIQTFSIESITMKYFVVGHTQNENDSVHAAVEKEKKRIIKGGPITHPSQLVTVIKSAKKTGKPYNVIEIASGDIFDWKKVAHSLGKNFNVNTNNEKVVWNKIRILHFENSSPFTIFYKYNYSDEFNTINIRTRISRSAPRMELQRAFDGPVKVNVLKKNYLLSLCREHVIPRVHWEYYENLPVVENENESEISETE